MITNQVVLSLKSGVVGLLLTKDLLSTALCQLSSYLENYFLSDGGQVALALSIHLYYEIVHTFVLVRSEMHLQHREDGFGLSG